MRRASAAARPLAPEHVPLAEAVGRRLHDDLVALGDVPHYDSSAMDGWAVAGSGPWRMPVPGATGTPHPHGAAGALGPHEAAVVLTGGLIPPGADRVVRSEHGTVSPDGRMLALDVDAPPPRPALHIRPRGEEAAAGTVVLPAHHLLNPASVAVAAACGHDTVEVSGLPRVRLVLTGDEVVTSGIPAPGRVRDSFGPTLPALVASLGGVVIESLRLPDSRPALVDALRPGPVDQGQGPASEVTDAAASAVRPSLVITTGGTGGSDADHLRAALEELGAELLIEGVAMRPGGPTLLAALPDGCLVLGLPGNPLAAMTGLLVLGRPLLAALGGTASPPAAQAVLAVEVTAPAQASVLLPCTVQEGIAAPTRWRGSGMLRGLAGADGVIVCPPGGLPAGATVEVLPLPWSPSPR